MQMQIVLLSIATTMIEMNAENNACRIPLPGKCDTCKESQVRVIMH